MNFDLGFKKNKDSHRGTNLTHEETQRALSRAIQEGGAYFVGRYGSSEYSLLRTMRCFEESEVLSSVDTPKLLPFRSWVITQKHRKMRAESDFFPKNYRAAQDFYRLMQDSARHLHLLGSWLPGDSSFFPSERPRKITSLDHLEPFYSKLPWSAALESKRVLIIHPLADTIRLQYEKRKKLFPHQRNVLPVFDLTIVEPPKASGRNDEEFEDWFDGLLTTYHRVVQHEFDVSIIDAGAYGFPLASWISQLGRPALQLGGVVASLFGITRPGCLGPKTTGQV